MTTLYAVQYYVEYKRAYLCIICFLDHSLTWGTKQHDATGMDFRQLTFRPLVGDVRYKIILQRGMCHIFVDFEKSTYGIMYCDLAMAQSWRAHNALDAALTYIYFFAILYYASYVSILQFLGAESRFS